MHDPFLTDDARIEAIVRRVLDRQVPPGLQGLLAGGFLKLLSSADVRLAFGSGTADWTAAVASATETIAHGLERVPQFIAVEPAPTANVPADWLMDTADDTNFTFRGRQADGAVITASQNYYWIALG